MHELLSVVFHGYVVLRSGWEWDLPHRASDFQPHSIFSGYQTALKWLREDRIPVERLISTAAPRNAQSVCQQLLRGEFSGLFALFDWSCL